MLQRGSADLVLSPDFLQPRLNVVSLDFPQPLTGAAPFQIVRPHLRISPICGRAFLLLREWQVDAINEITQFRDADPDLQRSNKDLQRGLPGPLYYGIARTHRRNM